MGATIQEEPVLALAWMREEAILEVALVTEIQRGKKNLSLGKGIYCRDIVDGQSNDDVKISCNII